MAPSLMHGRRRSHDGPVASMHDFPTLLESSLELREAMNVHPNTTVLVLHQRMLNLNLTFQQLGISALDLPELHHLLVMIRERASSCDFP